MQSHPLSQEAGSWEQVGLGYIFKNMLLLVPLSGFGGFLGSLDISSLQISNGMLSDSYISWGNKVKRDLKNDEGN